MFVYRFIVRNGVYVQVGTSSSRTLRPGAMRVSAARVAVVLVVLVLLLVEGASAELAMIALLLGQWGSSAGALEGRGAGVATMVAAVRCGGDRLRVHSSREASAN
jgi:hypothetical protein